VPGGESETGCLMEESEKKMTLQIPDISEFSIFIQLTNLLAWFME
jgi:hypothetical protein